MNSADQEKFVLLLGQVQPDLKRYIYSLSYNKGDAEDIYQECSLALWRKFGTYDNSQPFLNWAFRFAYYEVMKFREKQKRRKLLSDETLKILAEEYQKPLGIIKEQERLLSFCLAKLPEDEKALIDMRYSQKLSVKKINSHFGETGKKIYRAFERIRYKLYNCIDETLEAEGLK
ncbi:sigma-70 family RNA polymerase sigma factor [Lentisphaera profundi]|uniref:Sigma-70 family RNA polymerase sigma factor n=1 Tax=Lentisphaera profundi TaxID=1658616 RepID=A0ABY7VPF7_9BACT|nr:sigma-70 family RNA polymerase sigma factor [Lentisphaera profundi]WDE95599.1 sigma-70 family RNA polymerase sigma factor [Lentisphaera profundi]